MLDIKEKIWNIEMVVEDIKQMPQTYNTILKEYCTSGTCQTILRRKLNKLCKEGLVRKTVIPGTRFGQVVFYCEGKKYYILVDSERTGSAVYCFFDYEKRGQYYIKVSQCWKLVRNRWEKEIDKVFFEGNVLKFI